MSIVANIGGEIKPDGKSNINPLSLICSLASSVGENFDIDFGGHSLNFSQAGCLTYFYRVLKLSKKHRKIAEASCFGLSEAAPVPHLLCLIKKFMNRMA
jgi:hypothetical protein